MTEFLTIVLTVPVLMNNISKNHVSLLPLLNQTGDSFFDPEIAKKGSITYVSNTLNQNLDLPETSVSLFEKKSNNSNYGFEKSKNLDFLKTSFLSENAFLGTIQLYGIGVISGFLLSSIFRALSFFGSSVGISLTQKQKNFIYSGGNLLALACACVTVTTIIIPFFNTNLLFRIQCLELLSFFGKVVTVNFGFAHGRNIELSLFQPKNISLFDFTSVLPKTPQKKLEENIKKGAKVHKNRGTDAAQNEFWVEKETCTVPAKATVNIQNNSVEIHEKPANFSDDNDKFYLMVSDTRQKKQGGSLGSPSHEPVTQAVTNRLPERTQRRFFSGIGGRIRLKLSPWFSRPHTSLSPSLPQASLSVSISEREQMPQSFGFSVLKLVPFIKPKKSIQRGAPLFAQTNREQNVPSITDLEYTSIISPPQKTIQEIEQFLDTQKSSTLRALTPKEMQEAIAYLTFFFTPELYAKAEKLTFTAAKILGKFLVLKITSHFRLNETPPSSYGQFTSLILKDFLEHHEQEFFEIVSHFKGNFPLHFYFFKKHDLALFKVWKNSSIRLLKDKKTELEKLISEKQACSITSMENPGGRLEKKENWEKQLKKDLEGFLKELEVTDQKIEACRQDLGTIEKAEISLKSEFSFLTWYLQTSVNNQFKFPQIPEIAVRIPADFFRFNQCHTLGVDQSRLAFDPVLVWLSVINHGLVTVMTVVNNYLITKYLLTNNLSQREQTKYQIPELLQNIKSSLYGEGEYSAESIKSRLQELIRIKGPHSLTFKKVYDLMGQAYSERKGLGSILRNTVDDIVFKLRADRSFSELLEIVDDNSAMKRKFSILPENRTVQQISNDEKIYEAVLLLSSLSKNTDVETRETVDSTREKIIKLQEEFLFSSPSSDPNSSQQSTNS